jgi:hypothetical protein
LNVTVPVLWSNPKPVPLIWIEVPTVPELGDKLVMLGSTVKNTELLGPDVWDGPSLALTNKYPENACPAGTGNTMAVSLQLVTGANPPRLSSGNSTPPAPWVAPKPLPVIVIEVPTTPEVGETEEMTGVGKTVNVPALLEIPKTVTTSGPVVAPVGTCNEIPVSDHPEMIAGVPLNVTVLELWVAPKFEPCMKTFE